MVVTFSKGKDQPGKVANPARGQLNEENSFLKKNQNTPSPSEHPPVRQSCSWSAERGK